MMTDGAVDLGILARQPATHPLPQQLEQLLLDVASQTATPTAWAEERLTWTPGFADPARHVAPTLAARRVLHVRGAPVWAHMGPAARAETLETLVALHPIDEPRVRWILFALDRGARMGETTGAPLAPLVDGRLDDLEGDAAAALALAGMTVVEDLAERWHEARSWAAVAERAGDRWRVGLMRTLAERSARLRESAIGALLGLVQQPRFGVAAATALLSLVRGGLWPVEALTRGWTSFPEHVRREPVLARDFQRETRRGRRPDVGGGRSRRVGGDLG